MAEGVAPYYTLRNHGKHRNCTLTAVFPAVISLVGIDVGGRKDGVNYDVSLDVLFVFLQNGKFFVESRNRTLFQKIMQIVLEIN